MPTSERLALAALLATAGCQQRDENPPAALPENVVASAAGDRILCAGAGDATLSRACRVDREQGDGGQVLTLRRADGGFRRLTITADGRGVVAADGAQPAKVTITGPGEIEVAVAGERYRLPATVKGTK